MFRFLDLVGRACVASPAVLPVMTKVDICFSWFFFYGSDWKKLESPFRFDQQVCSGAVLLPKPLIFFLFYIGCVTFFFFFSISFSILTCKREREKEACKLCGATRKLVSLFGSAPNMCPTNILTQL